MQTRRDFLRRSSAAAVAVFVPPSLASASPRAGTSALLRGGRFAQGVLSGEPTVNGITLLTILDDVSGTGQVELEVARDRDFRRVVTRRRITTSPGRGHSVKARLTNLDPYEQYYYRFETRDERSAVGRFRTALPADSNEPVRFAFFSCADFTHGYYNAYDVMSRLDLDFVVNLGDYIYAETYHSTRGERTGVRNDRVGRVPRRGAQGLITHEREAVTLDHYRRKYALYRSDRALRAVHSRFPVISIWDDHELQDNYAGRAQGGGLDSAKGWSAARRRAAYKAFFENMPFFPVGSSRIYRAQQFGSSVDLIMLDERQYRADQPCNDEVREPCAEWDQPRAFLGEAQKTWFKQRLEGSKAVWKVIGNEVMAMPAKVGANTYFTFDMWHGYPREREEILQHIKTRGVKDVAFITGDIHSFFAGDVRTQMGQGETVALEFVGGSITSSNLGETDIDLGGGNKIEGNDRNPNTPPALINALRGLNPWVDTADFDHHGFGLVRATPTELDVTLKRIRTIKSRSRSTLSDDGFRYRVARGQTSIKGVNGPA